MARTKNISDPEALSVVLQMLLTGGEKSVTFASIAKATQLAPSTLVQRFGSCAAMVVAALTVAWDQMDADLATVEQENVAAKGVQGLLKALSGRQNIAAILSVTLQHPTLLPRARQWRDAVEQALALRLGAGAKARESAALIFAAWQGRMLWDGAGGKGFRLGEALKRLG